MTMEKFRSFEDARRSLWSEPADTDLPRRIRAVWARATLLCAASAPRGLPKFRDMEDANEERDAWVTARVRSLKEQREKD